MNIIVCSQFYVKMWRFRFSEICFMLLQIAAVSHHVSVLNLSDSLCCTLRVFSCYVLTNDDCQTFCNITMFNCFINGLMNW